MRDCPRPKNLFRERLLSDLNTEMSCLEYVNQQLPAEGAIAVFSLKYERFPGRSLAGRIKPEARHLHVAWVAKWRLGQNYANTNLT
jgi:hypothetical protein